ncbi:MAG TPA: JAB domain-containing protein [Allosphingosinicella sp.]|nr:JAB domain-containing protein [Allosphingosinicella sp.]
MLIATAQDAVALFEPCFAGVEGEAIAVAHLDGDRRLIELVVIDPAAPHEAELPLRRILEDALRLGAAGLVLAHNHPSGDAQPSWDDVEATRELASTAARLGIRLHDHLIFADAEPCSLRGLGLL